MEVIVKGGSQRGSKILEFRVELIIGSDSKGWESEKEQERGLKFRVELIIGSDSKGKLLLSVITATCNLSIAVKFATNWYWK